MHVTRCRRVKGVWNAFQELMKCLWCVMIILLILTSIFCSCDQVNETDNSLQGCTDQLQARRCGARRVCDWLVRWGKGTISKWWISSSECEENRILAAFSCIEGKKILSGQEHAGAAPDWRCQDQTRPKRQGWKGEMEKGVKEGNNSIIPLSWIIWTRRGMKTIFQTKAALRGTLCWCAKSYERN